VSAQFGPDTTLSKDDAGLWSVTIPAVPAGVHEYRFVVDGLSVIDPQNSAVKPQRWPGVSILHVPSNPPAPWDLQDIPHGVLHEHLYRSSARGDWRTAVVYTPARRVAKGRLPVLYLSHGYSDNEQAWSVHGKAHWIMDALIASKKAVPMIVVMPDAHALPPQGGGWEEYASKNTSAFAQELKEDLIPLIEKEYRVQTGPKGRAFAGLSMGGHHALAIAMNHHDVFGWVGAYSAAVPTDAMLNPGLATPELTNKRLNLFWIACGEKDFLFQANEKLHALLKERGIRHDYLVTPGDHSWPVWRKYLTDFTPLLFR